MATDQDQWDDDDHGILDGGLDGMPDETEDLESITFRKEPEGLMAYGTCSGCALGFRMGTDWADVDAILRGERRSDCGKNASCHQCGSPASPPAPCRKCSSGVVVFSFWTSAPCRYCGSPIVAIEDCDRIQRIRNGAKRAYNMDED